MSTHSLPQLEIWQVYDARMEKFPEKLFQLRKAKGMSQEEVGGIVGVTRAAVQQWEKGRNVPSLHHLMELARFFDISLAELAGADEASASIDGELRLLPEDVRMVLQASFMETIRQFKARGKP